MTSPKTTNPALVSTGTRIATVVAVAATLSVAWLAASDESRSAVQASAAAMTPKTMYVTLPTVEIVGQRVKAGGIDLARQSTARPATL